MFKVRMQGQYGAETDKRLRAVVSEMWKDWGFRKGIMRGYWVSCCDRETKIVLLNTTDLG
jgi:solute carrier family 25 carnitine/acylcarnitine transporter 20/29